MTGRERGTLIGLAIVLAAAVAFIVMNRKDDEASGPPPAPEGWDLSRLPNLGNPVREYKTDGGVVVQVLREGRGEPVQKGQAMDIAYAGYSLRSGAMFERNVRKSLVLARGGVIEGWIEGLDGIKLRELRRLLIPADMAYGGRRHGNIAANSDLVYDVEWVQLEIEDLKAGTGKEAKLGSTVLVHYKGTLDNGVEFDSSYKRGDPIEFKLVRGGLIDGWIKGIPGMKVGGVRKLWVPWHLAYGARAKGQKIGPYSNLNFVVELLDVK